MFYQDFYAKALVLVNHTVLEMFYQDFYAKAKGSKGGPKHIE
jgi:hypothetical protein